LLHVQMYITLIFSGKDKQKAFSRIGWLWATITSGDTCWNAALSKKLLCKREVRDTVQHISFPFCLTLGDQQLIFFAVPVSMKIEKFCGILLMSMLHYSRDYPEYFGPFFHAILFSWPSRNFAESFHQHGLVAGYFFLTMWFPGMQENEQLCREAKLAHCGAFREVQVCNFACYVLTWESNHTNAHSHSIPLIQLFNTFIIIGKCLAIGFHPSAHVFSKERW
jgi:hypothetical protein